MLMEIFLIIGTISLSQAEQDKDCIYNFRDFISKGARIRTHQDKRENRQKSYIFSFGSQEIKNDLIKLGCIPRKTFLLKFPNIKEDLYSHFIRGYFDGDGCISINSRNEKKWIKSKSIYKTYKRIGYDFNILSTKEMLESIKNIFVKKLNINCKIIKRHKSRDNNNYTLIILGRKQIKKTLDYMYYDAKIYGKRKYEKYLKV